MKHLKIWFVDGVEEELESCWTEVEISQGIILYTFGDMVGGRKPRGPTYVIRNIKKYAWVEGYK